MAQANGEITAPVSISDVKNAISANNNGLGELCAHANVNKWSKYKPVPKNLIDTTDQLNSDKTWKSSATWWKGNNNNCGIIYRSGSLNTSVASVMADIRDKRVLWTRDAPAGGSNAPYRLTDFNQYHHGALPPTYAIGAGTLQLRAGATFDIQIATSVDDGYNVRLSHIGTFNSYYFTVAIYDTSGNLKLIHSGTKLVSQYGDGESIDISIPYNNGSYGYQGKLSAGNTYKIYAFMSSVQYICQTSEFSGNYTYAALPHGANDYGMQPIEVTAYASSQWLTVDAFASGRIISWQAGVFGGGLPTGTLRLTDLQGNTVVVSNVQQSVTINFSNATQQKSGDSARSCTVTAATSMGMPGYTTENILQTTLTLPSDNPELYQLVFTSLNMTVTAIIGHDINPDI